MFLFGSYVLFFTLGVTASLGGLKDYLCERRTFFFEGPFFSFTHEVVRFLEASFWFEITASFILIVLLRELFLRELSTTFLFII